MKTLLFNEDLLILFLESEKEFESLSQERRLESEGIKSYDGINLENKITLRLDKSSEEFFPEKYLKKSKGDYRENKVNELKISVKGIEKLASRDFVGETIKEKDRNYKISIYTTDHPANPFYNQNPY